MTPFKILITVLWLLIDVSDTVSDSDVKEGREEPLPEFMQYNESSQFFIFPDGDGKLHVIDKNEYLPRLAMRSQFDISYYVYNRMRRNTPYIVLKGDTKELEFSDYDDTKPVKIIVHGWKSSVNNSVNQILVARFLNAMDVNVIVVDWSEGCSGIYLTSANNVPKAGKLLASFINWLIDLGTPLSNFHLLGHSLGAHVVGIAGRNVVSGKIPYITAFDPAGPLWGPGSERLRSDDADYVEVIHTNAGFAGTSDLMGNVDFFPNGGKQMPGCNSVGCSHGKSYEYYAETIGNPSYVGFKCKSVEDAFRGTCSKSEKCVMGGCEPKHSEGIFYLKTLYCPYRKAAKKSSGNINLNA